MDKKIITIIDVAKAAGVGKSTAARALSNKARVADATRKKVFKAAKELNYKPNIIFSIMASHRRTIKNKENLIPIALLHGEEDIKVEKFLYDNINRFGFYIEKIYVPENCPTVKLEKQLYDLGIVGVILFSINYNIINKVDFSNYSVISLHRGEKAEQKFNTVRPDRFYDTMQAWKKAMEYGHKKIGAAIGRQEFSSYDDGLRYGAVCECQQLWKDEIEYIPPYLGKQEDSKEFLKWYFKYKPTCIIGFQVHFYWELQDLGINIPKDLSFITLIRAVDKENESISGLDNSDNEAALTCLSQLDQLIRNRVRGYPDYPQSIYIASHWHQGMTLSQLKLEN